MLLDHLRSPQADNNSNGGKDRQLHGWKLIAAWTGWLLIVILALGIFITAVPFRFNELRTICVEVPCAEQLLSPAEQATLLEFGLSANFYAIYLTLVETILFSATVVVALLIFWRKSNDWLMILVSLTLITVTPALTSTTQPLVTIPEISLLVEFLKTFSAVAVFLLFFILPDGRFVPRWSWTPALLWAVWAGLWFFVPSMNPFRSPVFPRAIVLLVTLTTALSAQLYRYSRVSDSGQRQQTKWMVWGLIGLAFGYATFNLMTGILLGLEAAEASRWRLLLDFIGYPIFLFSLFLLPLSISISIFRYRLWDIDILVNRALVYGVLMGILTVVYLGGVIVLQHVFRALVAQEGEWAVAASTLGIAFLFQPLRRRVQDVIDRRFYRRKYDAAQTLAAFSATLRDQVDLSQLTRALVGVVNKTMQPVHIALWLRQPYGNPATGLFIAQTNIRHRDTPNMEEITAIAPDDSLVTYCRNVSGVVVLDRLRLNSPALESMRAAGSVLAVPLVSHSELIGLLCLGPRRSQQAYTADDHQLLQNLATRVAPAVRVTQLVRQQQAEIQARERMEQELRVARHIQHSLLPKDVPEQPGWQIATYYQPAHAVGGDFYDFLELPDGRLAVIIGDVTDKGIPAALVMATTRSTLRAAAQRLISPGQVLAQANNLICTDIPEAMFVTCLYAVLDPSNGRLRYANAGHSLPYWRRDGHVVKLWATGMPLGLMPDQRYEEKEITIATGESILFYSDGLIEAHNRDRQILGPAHLQSLIADHTGDLPLIDVLVSKLAQFTGHDVDPEDDVTLVTLSRMQEEMKTAKKIQPRKTGGQQSHVHPALPAPLPAPCTKWRALAHFELPSKRGQDRWVMQLISEVTATLNLSPRRLERLHTAVTEAVLNAMEHGHGYDPTKFVSVEILLCEAALLIRVSQREGPPIPNPGTPDLPAKVAGYEEPRGWGLFLMQNLVDDMRIHNGLNQRTVELIMHLESDEDAPTAKAL